MDIFIPTVYRSPDTRFDGYAYLVYPYGFVYSYNDNYGVSFSYGHIQSPYTYSTFSAYCVWSSGDVGFNGVYGYSYGIL